MKNKGRKHLTTSGNCKGCLTGITRPINQMGKGVHQFMTPRANKLRKKAWSKRVRGYFKTAHWGDIE